MRVQPSHQLLPFQAACLDRQQMPGLGWGHTVLCLNMQASREKSRGWGGGAFAIQACLGVMCAGDGALLTAGENKRRMRAVLLAREFCRQGVRELGGCVVRVPAVRW